MGGELYSIYIMSRNISFASYSYALCEAILVISLNVLHIGKYINFNLNKINNKSLIKEKKNREKGIQRKVEGVISFFFHISLNHLNHISSRKLIANLAIMEATPSLN